MNLVYDTCLLQMQATRRNLVQLAGAAASGLLGAKMSGFAIATAASEASVSSAPPPIERLTIRRRGVGLRGYDPERAFAGFTLFSPLSSSNKTVYLVDMLGNVVHTWTMPYPPGQSGYLTERGTLFYNGQIPNESHVGQAPYRGGAALEMDWKGRILWEVNHPDHNHDGIRLKNGNVLLICQKPLPVDLVPKVRGGRPGSEYDDGKMDAPYLVEMTISGQIVWEWLSWEHLDPGQDMITADQDDRDVWTVANGVSEMPDGNLLVSFRDISTVVMINRRTGAIYWKLGAPPLAGQHAPHILSNGNLLLFDNGPHRLDHSFPFSRVLEIDPATKAIVWKYQEARVSDFFSPRISNAQRLPNGNTFINEGWFGRFFEVTRDGAVVWEYVNPYFGRRQQLMINAVQRAYRYSAADIARAQSAA
jgi:Arylsulfotransferase (ASST)